MTNKIKAQDTSGLISAYNAYVSDFETYSAFTPSQVSTTISNEIGAYRVIKVGAQPIKSVVTNSKQDVYKALNKLLQQSNKRP